MKAADLLEHIEDVPTLKKYGRVSRVVGLMV